MSESENETIVEYWLRHYATRHCTLCGNSGVIDTRGVRTPAGAPCGRLNYCICPNGVIMREHGARMVPPLRSIMDRAESRIDELEARVETLERKLISPEDERREDEGATEKERRE